MAAQRRYRRVLATEAAIGMIVNAVLGGLVFWLSFGGPAPVAIWGTSGLVFDTLPSTFAPILLMTLLLTTVIRRRRGSGEFDVIARIEEPAWSRVLPDHLLARAFALALTATAATTLIVATLFAAWGGQTLSYATAFVIRLIQNVLLGLVFSPVVVARALAEHHSAEPVHQ